MPDLSETTNPGRAEGPGRVAGAGRSMRVLVVDDEPMTCRVVREFLISWGYETETVERAGDALASMREGHPVDVVITDLTMPGMNGLALLGKIKTFDPGIEVILMTGYATVETAVDAMRKGAHDYITKPIHFDELHILLERLKRARQLNREIETLRLELHKKYAGGVRAALVGSSPAIRRVVQTVGKISQSKATVLISGESGTGKELVARAIHYSGVTANGPFLAINCGGVSRSLLESQLFGHVKGAFTDASANTEGYFRAADGGTLVLDEITEMVPEVQVKLLRALQEREVTPVGATLGSAALGSATP